VKGKKMHKSYFALGLLTCVSYMGEALRIPLQQQRGLENAAWWDRLKRMQPDMVDKYTKEIGIECDQTEGTIQELMAGNYRCFANVHEGVGKGVIDTACNRSMVGELTLLKDIEDLNKLGLGVAMVDSQDKFTFGVGF